jgi:pimeloyl-ACP methyl ester carboxylesterase
MQIEDRYFEASRLRLHYVVYGDESKPALVLVHGSRDHARSWDYVAERLVDHYALYALDLRGHGDSEHAVGGSYPLAAYCGDLAKFIDVLDRPTVNILGHSLGGRIVLDTTAAFPERIEKAVAIEGFGRMGSLNSPQHQIQGYVKIARELEARAPRPYPTIEAAEARLAEENKRLTPEMVRHLTKYAVRQNPDGTYGWKFDNYTRLTTTPEWSMEETKAMWGQISRPVLFIGGEESWSHRFPGREVMADLVPDRKVIVFENAGHWVHHDQLEGFVAAVRDFFG